MRGCKGCKLDVSGRSSDIRGLSVLRGRARESGQGVMGHVCVVSSLLSILPGPVTCAVLAASATSAERMSGPTLADLDERGLLPFDSADPGSVGSPASSWRPSARLPPPKRTRVRGQAAPQDRGEAGRREVQAERDTQPLSGWLHSPCMGWSLGRKVRREGVGVGTSPGGQTGPDGGCLRPRRQRRRYLPSLWAPLVRYKEIGCRASLPQRRQVLAVRQPLPGSRVSTGLAVLGPRSAPHARPTCWGGVLHA